jgi:succinate dehydrogenase / fumarate reductase flavoprotein subunit
MQRTMQRHCAVFRNGKLPADGLSALDNAIAMMRDHLGVTDRSLIFNTDLVAALELDNMLAQASASLHATIGRTESRGAHAREDFPKRDDENWLKHTLSWHDDDGCVRLACRPVHLQPLSNEVSSIPPKERVCRFATRERNTRSAGSDHQGVRSLRVIAGGAQTPKCAPKHSKVRIRVQ